MNQMQIRHLKDRLERLKELASNKVYTKLKKTIRKPKASELIQEIKAGRAKYVGKESETYHLCNAFSFDKKLFNEDEVNEKIKDLHEQIRKDFQSAIDNLILGDADGALAMLKKLEDKWLT